MESDERIEACSRRRGDMIASSAWSHGCTDIWWTLADRKRKGEGLHPIHSEILTCRKRPMTMGRGSWSIYIGMSA